MIVSLMLLFLSFQIFVQCEFFFPKIDEPDERNLLQVGLTHISSPWLAPGKVPQPSTNIVRLKDDLLPISYDLKIVPNLKGNFSFYGEVTIKLRVAKSTREILLHSRELKIVSVETFRDNKRINNEFHLIPKYDLLNVTMRQKGFRKNKLTIKIKFDGILNDMKEGFYRSHYTVGNVTKWLATTQFEPTEARMAFPCFDEPKFRATFNITVARYSYQKVISNMPLKSTSSSDPLTDNRVWDTFQQTPPMPTYLVAFIISEFHYRTDSESKVKIWARENAINDTIYSQIQAVGLLKNMEQLIGVPYTLPKLDLAAIPDFSAGAMENWGLITFRQNILFCNPRTCTDWDKEYLSSFMAHEISHQWFGDLVTISWWDHLWLNDGFATYFQYHLLAKKEPNWRSDEKFVPRILHAALGVDSIYIHKAMVEKVSSTVGIFNAISYYKAASVIRMMEHVVSSTTFIKALRSYLIMRSQAGGVAESSHLYSAFDKEMRAENKYLPQGLSITKIFKTFSEQIGYPCITVSRHTHGDKVNITITQESYKSPRSEQNITEKTWPIPLACTKQSKAQFENTQPTMWLTDKKMTLLNEVQSDEWFICNLQQSGYYRVKYDTDSWKLIVKQLHSSHLKIHQLNRAQLIDDSFTFLWDNYLSISSFLDLCKYLEREIDPIPWSSALPKLYHLVRKYEGSSASTEIWHFGKHLVERFYNYVGFYIKPGDSHSIKCLRTYLILCASDLEIEDVLTKAHSEFFANKDLDEVPAYMKKAVFCSTIRKNSNETVWNKLWSFYKSSNSSEVQRIALTSFGCSKSEENIKKLLFKLVDEKDHDIRQEHEDLIYQSARRFPAGVMASINFVHDMLPKLGNFSRAHNVTSRLLSHLNEDIKSNEQLKRLDHVIDEAGHVDQKKYGDIKVKLVLLKNESLKLFKKNEEVAEEIIAALRPPSPPSPKPTTTAPPTSPPHHHTHPPPPSAATYAIANFNLFFSTFLCLLFLEICQLLLIKT